MSKWRHTDIDARLWRPIDVSTASFRHCALAWQYLALFGSLLNWLLHKVLFFLANAVGRFPLSLCFCIITDKMGWQNSLVPKTQITEFANSVDLDELAYNEPPHLDLHCLTSSLWILSVLKLGLNFFLKICRRKFCRLLLGSARVNFNELATLQNILNLEAELLSGKFLHTRTRTHAHE